MKTSGLAAQFAPPAWTNLSPPPQRNDPSPVYRPAQDSMYIFGGTESSDTRDPELNRWAEARRLFAR